MKYAKAIMAAIGGLATVLLPALADNIISLEEWQKILSELILAFITVYGVWRAPNQDSSNEVE